MTSFLINKSRAGLCVGLTAFVVMALSASTAFAAEPWWHLDQGARPTLLHAPVSEVQEVQAQENSTHFLVVELTVEGTAVACVVNKISEGACKGLGLPVDRTAAQLQSTLEGVYGAGDVQVGGGPAGGAAFTVTTLEREVPPLAAVAVDGTASAKQISGEGGSGRLVLLAVNLGDAPTSGPVTISDALPEGLTATKIAGTSLLTGLPEEEEFANLKCVLASVSCTFTGTLEPYYRVEMVVWVTGKAVISGERNELSVSGGGAREASLSRPVSYGEGPVPFGVESAENEPEAEGGVPDTQAGSHPFQLTDTFRLNETESPPFQPAQPRNLEFYLPAGFVGDAQATPQCSYAEFESFPAAGFVDGCPADTAIGVSMQELSVSGGFYAEPVPVFNLTPARGEPARFGFEISRVPIILDTSVRTGGDYGVTVSVRNLTEVSTNGLSSILSIWGVPGAASHNQARGWECLPEGEATLEEQPGCGGLSVASLPLVTLPSACEAFQAPMQVQSWQPGAQLVPQEPFKSEFEETLDGCNRQPFGARVEAAPDVQSASSPSGLTVHVRVPQEAALNPEGLTDSDVRDMTVALPAGVTLNPGGANGLGACGEHQIGFQGAEAGEPARDLFTPTLEEPFCPDASKIATVKITTPLLPNPLEGSVYLADPADAGEAGMNPFNSLVAMYVVAEDPVSGTILKLPGKVMLCETVGQSIAGMSCEAQGQIVTTFEDSPQLPFEDAELHFFGGENAPLATPALCGAYTTHATFVPWSGGAPVNSTSTFDITSGPHGAPCADPQPFNPEFQAGSTNIQAGGFTELLTTMGHPDADQTLGGLTVKMPPGLSGLLSGVKLCEEPQAAQGTCGAESLIGHTIVTAGLGSSPAVVKRPGNVYITGPYKGAPFGLSIANSTEAGPFDLEKGTPCDCIVVRAKIEVNPTTAALTVTSDPLPTIVKGIPLDVQHVQVAIDRPGFTFNPTNCSPMKIEGSMSSSQGATAPVSTPFQATNCATLAFKPGFKVSTSGKTSRADGASLNVKLTYPNAPLGSQANISKVKVDLPKQLPSRLSTLQKACPAATFDANPASCPVASIVGHAKAITPLLPVPLEGPAYFVSHGGEEFPNLIIVLQGYGVTLDLVGTTFIDEKTGITSSTFKTVPDAPVGSFELTLPQGPNSALAATANLCAITKTVIVKKKVTVRIKGHEQSVTRKVKSTVAGSLAMPTAFTAQNGAEIHESTPIGVTGCTPTRAKKVTSKKAKKSGHGKRKSKHK